MPSAVAMLLVEYVLCGGFCMACRQNRDAADDSPDAPDRPSTLPKKKGHGSAGRKSPICQLEHNPDCHRCGFMRKIERSCCKNQASTDCVKPDGLLAIRRKHS